MQRQRKICMCFTLVFLIFSSAFAKANCPDFTGTYIYQYNEYRNKRVVYEVKTTVKMSQHACDSAQFTWSSEG